MNRLAVALVCLSLATTPSYASTGSVDLNAPGAIEALARDNPEHYAKIAKILQDVAQRPPEAVPRWMKSEFGAEQVAFPSLLKTSDPPKRSLAFTLDRTRYEVVVTVPARWSFVTR